MKIPKTVRKYCKFCKKHTEHTVELLKGRIIRRGLSFGSRRAREEKKGKGNHGKYSKRPMSQRKRANAKSSKGVDLRIICKECKKAMVMEIDGRYKRVELK